MDKETRVWARLDREQAQKLRRLAQELGVTRSEVIRRLVQTATVGALVSPEVRAALATETESDPCHTM